MNRYLAASMLGCMIALCSGAAIAQNAATPADRERSCALRARSMGLTGTRYSLYMRRCTRVPTATGGPVAPPAQNPSAVPPRQPSAPQPQSPRARSCGQAAQELGLAGAAAQTYVARCVAGSSTKPATVQQAPSRTVSCNKAAQELGLTGPAAQSYVARCAAH